MRIDELRAGQVSTVEVCCDGGFDPLPKVGAEARLRLHQGEVLLGVDGSVWTARGAHAKADRSLAALMAAGLPFVAWVAVSQAKKAIVHVRTFAALIRLPSPVVVKVDDGTRELVRLRCGFGGTAEEVARWLEGAFLLGAAPGDDPAMRRAVVSVGEGTGLRPLRLYGKSFSVDLSVHEDALAVERIVRGHAPSDAAVRLLVAPLAFRDASVTGALAASTRASLNEAVRASGSYLEIWRRYAELDAQQVEAREAAFGAIRYEACVRRDGAWEVTLAPDETLDERFGALGEGDSCFALAPHAAGDEPGRKGKRERQDGVVLRLTQRQGARMVLVPLDEDATESPPGKGYVRWSALGDKKRIERRQQAEERIREGTGRMPQLGLILEGREAPQTHYKRHKAMSAAAREAFGRTPTTRQQEALDVALNTPDIAMIQGPPGTGKTSVIAAIERRLAELEGGDVGVPQKILVTSAQHDAVDNVAARTKVFDLPAMKVGSRRDGDGAGLDQAELFQRDQVEKLRASLRDETESERLRHARDRIVALLAAPGVPADNARALDEICAAVEGLAPPALLDALAARARSLAAVPTVDDDGVRLARRAAESIRGTPAQFGDDGPVTARKARVRLDGVLREDEAQLLARAAAWTDEGAPTWLDALARLREDLLDRLQVHEPLPTRALDADTVALLTRLIDALREGLGARRTQEESVVAGFLHELDTDPDGVRATLQSYTAVLAATLQQSVSSSMRRARGIEEGSVDFESVIVDEAARAHPLDLFIPLVTARRRIVLVGDHRQLPHMLEPDVERELRGGDLTAETRRALEESLFQRLWNLLKARERLDGVQRTVTLDEQFRMNPVLGDFVSAAFYEGADKDDLRIRSPRPAADFLHGLAGYTVGGTERVAAWVDVPQREGGERGRRRSRYRPSEARRVAALARSILAADESLSVGVIAFYSAQVDEIASELARRDMVEERRDDWRVRDAWRTGRGRNGEVMERFRLGTVDAFQGKEFDVVILSVTRSNEMPSESDAHRRRKYGHLLLENRLCVAMSRQRRLLIVVGDLDFVRSAEALPALRSFVTLCEGPHGCVA